MTIQAAAIRVRLIGSPCLLGTSLQALERHDAALIALLAIEGAMPRARMATWLWPDAPQAQARGHLRQRLLRLRRAAGASWLEGDLTLRLADGCVDLQTAAAALAAEPATALSGDLLAGLDYSDIDGLDDWVRTAREQWRRTRIELLSSEAAAHESARRLVAALAFANRIVEEEPLQEVAHRRVMRLHYLRGDRAAALVAAQACVQTLEHELGIAPDAETRGLIASIEAATAALPRPPLPEPLALRRPPRLIGREAAWHDLERLMAERAAVLVTGEAGIGKTRLLEDFGRSRPVILMVSALSGDDRLPYATLAQVLRAAFGRYGAPTVEWARLELARLVPSLGAAPETPLDPLRLAGALDAETERWHAGGLRLLILDDLHFCDAATLQVLPPLVGRSTACSGFAWVLAARTAEIPAAIDAWADKAGPRGLRRIELAPLGHAQVVELLESIAIDELDAAASAPALLRQTGGNPFFLLETLLAWLRTPHDRSAGAEASFFPVSASARALVKHHVERLAPLPLRLARTMALAGQDFDDRLAAAVFEGAAGDLETAWRALETHRVLVDDRLAHDLLRLAVIDATPPPTARALHGQIAEALDHGASRAPPARIADHWAAAGRLERAAPRWVEAARQAEHASRFDEMQALYERAAEGYASMGRTSEQRKALQETVTIAVRRQDLAAAARIAEGLTALAENDEARAGALDRQCEVAIFGREDALAESLARQGLALAADSPKGPLAFHLSRKLAVALGYVGRHDEALAQMEGLRSWAEAHPDGYDTRVWLADRASLLDMADRLPEARSAFEALLVVERRAGDDFAVYGTRCVLALLCHTRGELAASLAGYEEALRGASHLGEAYTVRNPRGATRRAPVWRDAGRHGTALRWLEQSRSILASGSNDFLADRCDDQLALSHFELGDRQRAFELVAPEPASGHVEARALRAFVRARIARLQGRPIDVPVSFETYCPRRLLLPLRLEASRLATSPGSALAAQRDVEQEASTHGLDGIGLHACVLAARSAIDAGRRDEAERRIRSAMDRLSTLHPTGLTRAEAQWLAVDVLQRLGDRPAAHALAEAAVRELRECGDVPAAFRHRFLNAHPVHRALVLAAAATGQQAVGMVRRRHAGSEARGE